MDLGGIFVAAEADAAVAGVAEEAATDAECERAAVSCQASTPTAAASTTRVMTLRVRLTRRWVCAGRAASDSALGVRRTPSGVTSKAQASRTATGKPITRKAKRSRIAQCGAPKAG